MIVTFSFFFTNALYVFQYGCDASATPMLTVCDFAPSADAEAPELFEKTTVVTTIAATTTTAAAAIHPIVLPRSPCFFSGSCGGSVGPDSADGGV
ncbi:hypothetical protein [Parafrigoribacterium humi]|uniref:hypothetical protein n=1 Tax=Parafrigoribacterium humi TaxID=3144664 RepID=UPI0032EF9511